MPLLNGIVLLLDIVVDHFLDIGEFAFGCLNHLFDLLRITLLFVKENLQIVLVSPFLLFSDFRLFQEPIIDLSFPLVSRSSMQLLNNVLFRHHFLYFLVKIFEAIVGHSFQRLDSHLNSIISVPCTVQLIW